jgi:hypothetical protein
MRELKSFEGVMVYQDEASDTIDDMPTPQHGAPKPKRIHYIADLSVDVDGHPKSYRLDNRKPPALDDLHKSAGYPDGDWWNVLVADPDTGKPYVDALGFCVSMTSYQRMGYVRTDRRRYVNPEVVPYSVLPGAIRRICKGVVLGCASRITRVTDKIKVETVYADSSGGNIGEAGWMAAQTFGSQWSASNGDERRIYLYEFFPDEAALINGEQFKLIPL